MPQMLIEVLVDDVPLECANFELYELVEAHAWVQTKLAFYSPVLVDLLVTISDGNETLSIELIPEFNFTQVAACC